MPRTGCCCIGTCIAENRPVIVHRDEHFRWRHVGLSCSGAPIRDPSGALIAVLDASTLSAQQPRASVAHTMPYDLALMGDTTLLNERAPTVGVPTLVLDGGDSPPWGRRSADAVAAAVPGAERRTLDGQTHEVAPGVLAPVLAEFFARA